MGWRNVIHYEKHDINLIPFKKNMNNVIDK